MSGMITNLRTIAMFVTGDFMFRTELVYHVLQSLKGNRRFEARCRLHFQDRRISHARNKREAGCMTSRKIHGVISQKIDLFITIAVRPWNPTQLVLSGRIEVSMCTVPPLLCSVSWSLPCTPPPFYLPNVTSLPIDRACVCDLLPCQFQITNPIVRYLAPLHQKLNIDFTQPPFWRFALCERPRSADNSVTIEFRKLTVRGGLNWHRSNVNIKFREMWPNDSKLEMGVRNNSMAMSPAHFLSGRTEVGSSCVCQCENPSKSFNDLKDFHEIWISRSAITFSIHAERLKATINRVALLRVWAHPPPRHAWLRV
jgi:hypothetical protein